jgi:transcriptional regulator with XRE-family HTH domain
MMKINKGESYNDFIKRIRLASKLTQSEFALKIGYAPETISRWENGKKVPYFTQRVIDDFANKIRE